MNRKSEESFQGAFFGIFDWGGGLYAPDRFLCGYLYYPPFVLQDDARAKYPSPDDIPKTETICGTEIGAIYNMDAMSFDIYETIGNYKGDVLIVHGDKDDVVPLSCSERAATVYESANLIVFEGGGHGFRERIDEAAAYSLDFLRAHTA